MDAADVDTGELARRARGGDTEAFGELVTRYRGAALGVAYRRLGNRQDAEDVTQVTLLQAWRDLPGLREPERFAVWLVGIARNRCRDFLRQPRHRAVPLDEQSASTPAAAPGGAWEVRDAVADLPELQRVTATLFYIRGYRVSDIAGALGVPAGTVKRRLHDARRRLQQRLDPPPVRIPGGARMETTLEVADLLSLTAAVRARERIALSPDGRLLAFPVRRRRGGDGPVDAGVPEDVHGTELLVMDLSTDEVECITPGWGSAWCPRWSPDGTRLAFLSGRHGPPQLWLWEREHRTAHRVSAEPVVYRIWFEQLRWLPDGQRILVKLRTAGWRPMERAATVSDEAPRPDVWLSPPPDEGPARARSGWWDAYRGDLALVDARSGDIRRVTAGQMPWGTAVSPTGRHIATACLRSMGGDSPVASFDLHILDVDGPGHRVVAEGVSLETGDSFSWAPDGSSVACTTFGNGPGRLLLAAPDGSLRELHDGRAVDLGNEEGAPPLWSPGGEAIYCWAGMAIHRVDVRTGGITTLRGPADSSVYAMLSTTGSGVAADLGRPGTLLVMAQNRGTRMHGLWRLGADDPEVVVPEANRSLVDLSLCGDVRGTRIVGPVEDAAHPAEIFLFDTSLAPTSGRQASRLNASWPTAVAQAPRLLRWRDAAGGRRLATVLLPPGHREGQRHRTVVYAYGGEWLASQINDFGCGGTGAWNPLMRTARGYAVVLGLKTEEPADEIADLAVRALDAAAAEGLADPDRAAILGHSYGGYGVCATIARTDRLRAAVASAAPTDLTSLALRMAGNQLLWLGYMVQGQGGMGSAPWDAPERYVRNSPVYGVHRVVTPVLLFHGIADAMPVGQSEVFFAGLRRLGKPAALVRYPGEGHGPRD